MAQQQSQPEDAAAEGSAEEAATEGESTSATGTENEETGAPAGGAGAEKPETEGEKPEPTEEEKAAKSEWDEKVKAAALVHAKEQIQQANRTMAAARRAQKAAEQAAAPLRAELATAKHEAKIYGDFVKELQTSPLTAIGRIGFKTVKEFIDHCVETGGGREQTEEERIQALIDKRLETREAPRREAEQAEKIAAAKKAVFAHIDGQTERFDLVTTDVGHDLLWKKIEAYHKQHGVVPDEAIDLIADSVEAQLAANLAKSRKFGQSQPAKNGISAASAATAASTSGKSLSGRPTSGAPSPRKYTLNDPDALERELNAELKAEGLL